MSISNPVTLNSNKTSSEGSYIFALSSLTTLFFMWGFLTCLNDILIPHLKSVFSLNYTQAMLIQLSFFTAYFIVSVPSGKIVKSLGYKKGIVTGLIVAGVACLLFYPAASYRSYPMFLTALFVLASGITLLQVAANPYVTILGKSETASSRLNLTQAFNSLGTTIAPYFGSLLILSVAVKSSEEIAALNPTQLSLYQMAEASAVQVPYLGLAAVLFIIAGIFAFLRLPEVAEIEASNNSDLKPITELKSAWHYKHLILGAIGIFIYVGAEVSIGSFLVNYLGQPFIKGLKEADAAKYVSYYWGGAMVGRFLGSAIQRKIKPGYLLAFNGLMAFSLILISIFTNGDVAMFSILAVGFFNSIMFPTIFALALNGLGRHTSQGSGILCAAIVGGAIIPVIQGALADNFGIHHAFFLAASCYLYIAYYGWKGHIPATH